MEPKQINTLMPLRAQVAPRQTKQSQRLLDELVSVRESDAQRYADILGLVQHVENMTQIPLSIEQREALAIELTRLDESLPTIIQMAENVKRSTDKYGRMDFSLWINSLRTYTENEVGQIVNNIQARRVRKLQELKYTEEEIENAGLRQIEDVYRRRLQEHIDKRNEDLKKRVHAAERFIRTGSDDVRQDMVDLAIKRGLIDESEPFPKEIVHFFAAKMFKDIENYIRRMKA